MDFTLDQFANRIIDLFTTNSNFPEGVDPYIDRRGYSQELSSKHKGRNPLHLRQMAESSMRDSKTGTESVVSFDYGNERMEELYPHYHILQQAPVIRKAHRATVKSSGSQRYVKEKGKRDYEQVHWNGKTFTKEYSKNVRGSRINLNKTQMHLDNQFLNTDSNQYLNVHLGYIDRICDEIAPMLANEYGLKLGRKQDTGLIDEFANQEGVSIQTVLDALESFM